VAFQL